MMNLLVNLTRLSKPNFIENLDTEIFEHPNVHIYWKDASGKYLGSNNSMAFNCGYGSGSALVGLNDSELHGRSIAPLLQDNDKRIVATNSTATIVEPFRNKDNQEFKYYSCKSPLRTKDKKVIGVIGMSFKLDEGFFTTSILNLSADEKLLESDKNHTAIDLNILTHRQKCCLYYLVRGLTIKEIAKLQSLSSRTVEHYYEEIKLKFGCKTRSELIAKATAQLMLIPLF